MGSSIENGIIVFVAVERGTRLIGEFPVAVERGMRKSAMQRCQKSFQCCFLFLGARVFRSLAVFGASPDIADADTMAVMPGAVGSDLCDKPPCVEGAVAVDYIVIADVAETSGEVPLSDVGNGEVFAFRCCRTMDDEFRDGAHGSLSVARRCIF